MMPHRIQTIKSGEMAFLTWSEYAQHHRLGDELTSEELDRHRELFRRGYHRAYGQKRRQEKKRLPTEWLKPEYRKLKRFAKRYRAKSLNQFIKQCVLGYLENEYIEHDPVMAEELKKQIRAIGNNVNQVVHMLHVSREYTNRDAYQHLKTQIDVLQKVVASHRKQPPKLREQLEQLFAQVPESIDDFQRFLDQMKAKYSGNDH